MRDVIPQIDRWRQAGRGVAVATVVETWGSAPRVAGSKMAVSADGEVAGSVSGGCVEGAVALAARESLRSGRAKLLQFGVADEQAWAVGLACGGSIEVFVAPLDGALYEEARAAAMARRAIAVAMVVKGADDLLGRAILASADGPISSSLGVALDASVAEAAREAIRDGRSRRVALGPVELFIDVLLPSLTLVMVGGVHIAVALTTLAKALGYRTVVVDPREAFGNEARFPHADQLVRGWPDDALREIGIDASTAVAMLTHDPKLDDPALRVALASPAFYVGALGSRKTQERRRQRLLEGGLSEEQVARLKAPIGLDLGGRSPEEIALSVMAQVVATRNGIATDRTQR